MSPRSFPAEENSLLSSSLGGNRREAFIEQGRKEGSGDGFCDGGRGGEERVVNVIGSGRHQKKSNSTAKKTPKDGTELH